MTNAPSLDVSIPEQADIAVARAVAPYRDTPAVRGISRFAALGDQPPLTAVSAGMLGIGLLTGNRRLARAGIERLSPPRSGYGGFAGSCGFDQEWGGCGVCPLGTCGVCPKTVRPTRNGGRAGRRKGRGARPEDAGRASGASLHNLAMLLNEKGDHVEAEPLLHQALRAMERQLGPKPPKTLTCSNNLVDLLKSKAESGKNRRDRKLFPLLKTGTIIYIIRLTAGRDKAGQGGGIQTFGLSVHMAPPSRLDGRAPMARSRRMVSRLPVPAASIRLSSLRWETGVPSVRCWLSSKRRIRCVFSSLSRSLFRSSELFNRKKYSGFFKRLAE